MKGLRIEVYDTLRRSREENILKFARRSDFAIVQKQLKFMKLVR